MPAEDMAMNQSCYALCGRSGLSQLFLFMLTKEYAEELKKKAHGAVFDTITIETFSKLSVVRPADPLPQQFEAIVRPLFSLMLVLQRSITYLRESRDLLLPKLISGEVNVANFDTEAVAQGV
jgi:type I restriction enzyme S subunit